MKSRVCYEFWISEEYRTRLNCEEKPPLDPTAMGTSDAGFREKWESFRRSCSRSLENEMILTESEYQSEDNAKFPLRRYLHRFNDPPSGRVFGLLLSALSIILIFPI